jgi:MFS transporter, OFA family, oxalate/formate antiporter
VIIFVICGIAMLGLDGLRSYPLYLAGISAVGLCFGGYLALYPAVTADFFGTRNIGANYGWVYTAYGAGGIAGPYLAARFMRVVDTVRYDLPGNGATGLFEIGNYRPAFVAAGAACLAAAGIMFALRKRSGTP